MNHDKLYDDNRTPAEQAAMRFATDYILWQRDCWIVVNDSGYRSVPMEQRVAEDCALRWPAPMENPYRAVPMPRPVLEES